MQVKEMTERKRIKKATPLNGIYCRWGSATRPEDFLNFEDDELLAPMVWYGARSESASDKEQISDDAPNSDDESQEEEEEEEEEEEGKEKEGGNHADGKKGGIWRRRLGCIPVPHPDDLASDDDSEAEIVDIEEEEKRKAFLHRRRVLEESCWWSFNWHISEL